ncbi:MAG: PQQ-like beta-propeller repeat protein, partial [Dehalococcoidia bacterium]|nr:PQQ-like beta-propeller repeat protein [Dehalococcoidia bacterium]
MQKRTIGKVLILAVLLLVLASGLAIPSCQPAQGIPRGWSGVSVTDGALFLGSMGGKLVAIDKSTQQRLWPDVPFEQKQSSSLFSCTQGATAVAIYGTPAVTAGLVYITGYNGKMYAINRETGASRWVYPREDELDPIVGGPVAAGDKVYFGGSDGRLYALDAATGDKVWIFESEGKIWGTPAVNGDTVYIGSFDKKLYALNVADGSLKWEFPTEGAIVATPLVYDGTVYCGSFDRYLYALNEVDGSRRWKSQAGNWFCLRPVVDACIILAGTAHGKVLS